MCKEILLKFLFLIILLEFKQNLAFNLSPVPNLKLQRPNITTYKNITRRSYFGFTVVLREKCAFIGAPRDQSNLQKQAEIDEPGLIYKCALDFNSSNFNTTEACKPYEIESEGNILNNLLDSLSREVRDNQWLGGTMVGGSRHEDPLLVCAPRFAGGRDIIQDSSSNTYLHGVCYAVTNTMADKPSVKKIKNLNIKDYQMTAEKDAIYQYGQQGFSAHITKDYKEFLMGSPGLYASRGSVIKTNADLKHKALIPQAISERDSSYFGYAVSSGYLASNRTKKIHYVSTSIHSVKIGKLENSNGMVYIYHFSEDKIKIDYMDSGVQFGEYFGYALLVEDLNGDNWDDLIVSAPLHRVDEFDVGAVYVYVNEGDFTFRKEIIASPFKTEARFGTTMSMLGDTNQDGYNDIAIGAPFIDGHGAVAIYLGNANGLNSEPSIILGMEPPIEAKMFGHGLSNGFDIDGNGFNDLIVGAPESETIFIYRAYPIVDVEVSIRMLTKTDEPRIEIPQNVSYNLELEYCYKIKTKAITINEVELDLDITVDPLHKRMIFFNNNSTNTHLKVNATKDEKCQKESTTITNSTELFTPITQRINFTLVNDAENYIKEAFCNECVVLDSHSRREATSAVTFKHGCEGKAGCEPDLNITVLEMPSILVLGNSTTFFATYLIENNGENAYDMKIEFSSPFPFAMRPPNCQQDFQFETKLICNAIGLSYFPKNKNMTIKLGFDIKAVEEVSLVNITAKANSAGNEKTPENNYKNSTIIFQANSSFETVGQPNQTFESVYDQKDSKDVLYSFEIQNNGPSSLFNVQIMLLLPYAHKNHHFIDLENSRASLIREQIVHKTVHFSKMPLDLDIDFGKNNTYLNTEEQILPANQTISLYCNHTKTTNMNKDCGLAKLTILSLKPMQKLKINLFINIDPNAVRALLKDEDFVYLQSFLDVYIEPRSKQYVFLNMTKIINPLTFVNIGPKEIPLWIFIVAGVGGIVFLLIMSLVMKKLGFFKRQTKEEMEELINEKIEKERMKDELEHLMVNEETMHSPKQEPDDTNV